VVSCNAWGFLGVKATMRKDGSWDLLQLSAAKEMFDKVLDPFQWRVAETEPRLPSTDVEHSGRSCVQLYMTGARAGLLKYAARSGFRNLSVLRMRKLVLHLGDGAAAGLATADEETLVARLCRAVLGAEVSDEAVANALRERHRSGSGEVAQEEEQQKEEAAEHELMEILGEHEDDEAVKDVEFELSRLREARAAGAAARSPMASGAGAVAGGGGAGAAAPAAAGRARQFIPRPAGGLSVEWAKTLCPPTAVSAKS